MDECEYSTCPWQYILLLCLFNLFLGNVVRNAVEYVGGYTDGSDYSVNDPVCSSLDACWSVRAATY